MNCLVIYIHKVSGRQNNEKHINLAKLHNSMGRLNRFYDKHRTGVKIGFVATILSSAYMAYERLKQGDLGGLSEAGQVVKSTLSSILTEERIIMLTSFSISGTYFGINVRNLSRAINHAGFINDGVTRVRKINSLEEYIKY